MRFVISFTHALPSNALKLSAAGGEGRSSDRKKGVEGGQRKEIEIHSLRHTNTHTDTFLRTKRQLLIVACQLPPLPPTASLFAIVPATESSSSAAASLAPLSPLCLCRR